MRPPRRLRPRRQGLVGLILIVFVFPARRSAGRRARRHPPVAPARPQSKSPQDAAAATAHGMRRPPIAHRSGDGTGSTLLAARARARRSRCTGAGTASTRRARGEILGLLGPTAPASDLHQRRQRALPPDGGSITFDGQSIAHGTRTGSHAQASRAPIDSAPVRASFRARERGAPGDVRRSRAGPPQCETRSAALARVHGSSGQSAGAACCAQPAPAQVSRARARSCVATAAAPPRRSLVGAHL